jgi:outer membrane protein TolC
MKTLDHLQELLESLQKDAQAAVDAGLTTDTDLLLVKIKKNELRSGKIELQGGIRLLKMKLFNSIGQKYSFLESLSDSTAPYVDSIRLSDDFRSLLSPENYYKSEEQMLLEMDEGKLLSLMVQARELEKRMALGEVLPQVMVGASTGYSHITESQFNGTVFATISIPISDWGKASHKLKRLENQVQKAQNEQEYLQSMLLLQIRQLWLDLNICWDKMSVAAESVEMAKSSVEKQTNEYQAGLVSMSDLLTTQSSLFEAVEVYLNAQIEYSKALTAYLGRQ